MHNVISLIVVAFLNSRECKAINKATYEVIETFSVEVQTEPFRGRAPTNLQLQTICNINL